MTPHYSQVNFLLCIKLIVSRCMITALQNKHLNFTFQQHRFWQKYCLVKNGEGYWKLPYIWYPAYVPEESVHDHILKD